MPQRLQSILQYLGYAAWFGFVFVILTALTFPWSKVRNYVMVSAAASGTAVVMDKLSPTFVGARARGLSVASMKKDGEAGEPWLQLDDIKVRTGLFGALGAGRAAASLGGKKPTEAARSLTDALGRLVLAAKGYGGTADVELRSVDEDLKIELTLSSLNLDQVTFKVMGMELDPKGVLDGQGDLRWVWDDVKKARGDIDLAIDGLTVELPIVGTATCTLAAAHVKVDRGKADLRDTAVECDIAQAEATGHIALNENFMRSRLALSTKFKVSDEVAENPLVKAGLRSLDRCKDDDGWFHYQINGSISSPRARCSRSAARRSGSGSGSGSATRSSADRQNDAATRAARAAKSRDVEPIERNTMDDAERDAIEEQRAKLREERMKRREERRARREELLRKRRERQTALDSGEDVQMDGRRAGDLDLDEEARERMAEEMEELERMQQEGVEGDPPENEEEPPDEEFDEGEGDEGEGEFEEGEAEEFIEEE